MIPTLAALLATPATAGMTQVMAESGHFQLSIDGAGSSTTSAMNIAITRPSPGATVHRVFASVTSVYAHPDPGPNSLTIGGIALSLDQLEVDPASTVRTRFDDVTAELSAYLDGLAVGTTVLPVVEGGGPGDNDGNLLFVVWQDPAFDASAVSLSFGSVLTGSNPSLSIATEPIDTSVPGFHVDAGLAIAFSTGGFQHSSVEVNGVLVTADAGGHDDGDASNGGLFTIGGDGDTTAQERYDVTSLVSDGDTAIVFDIVGNTQDDYAVAMWEWAIGAVLSGCGPADPDADADGVADNCDLCPGGNDTLDGDADGVPDACDICPTGSDNNDTDLDGVPDACDACPGANDAIDADLDGAPDGCDICPGGDDRLDTDGDTVPDACDLCPAGDDLTDSDGDGIPDGCEGPFLFFASPKRGPLGGGSQTLLIGGNFDASCVASFDGVAATTWFVDPFTLGAEPAPHPAGLIDVAVVCAGGATDLIGGYTYYDDSAEPPWGPDVQKVLPNVVGTTGGESVIVGGTGFSSGAAVLVDGVPADATVEDDTRITVITPAHGEGIAALEVVNADGLSDSLQGALLYVADPALEEEVPEEDEGPGTGSDGGAGGCATSPAAGVLGTLVALLALRRRSALGLLVLGACNEYDVQANAEPDPSEPPGEATPVAITGPAAETPRHQPVTLDGTASYDPDDTEAALTYSWGILEQPPGAVAELDDPTAAQPTLTADTLGDYVVVLGVTNAAGLLSTNPAAQVVQVVPWRDLEVSLAWDQPVDLDLHLIAPGGQYSGPGDCFFGNPGPDWGTAVDGSDDPALAQDHDGSEPQGAEVVTLDRPAEGIYQVVVVYWNNRGQDLTVSGTVSVSGAGEVLATADVTVSLVGDAVRVGALDWSTLGWAADGTHTTHAALGGPPFND